MLAEHSSTLPKDVMIDTKIFRQADFIEAAIGNVEEAIRDGVIWVIVDAVPVPVELPHEPHHADGHPAVDHHHGSGVPLLRHLDQHDDAGRLAVAIGELVDDSIVDIENIYRRLKENRPEAAARQPDQGDLSGVVRGPQQHRLRHADRRAGGVSAVFAGRTGGADVRAAGLAYLTTLLASLVVSLTVTPVLASYLLPQRAVPASKSATRSCSAGSSGSTLSLCGSRCGTARPS